MRSTPDHTNSPFRGEARPMLVAALAVAMLLMWSHHGGPALESPAQAQFTARSTMDRTHGADAAIMAARDIVLMRHEATGFDWQADNAADHTAEEISRLASLIIRNYRPYVVPDRTDPREPRLRVIPPEQGQQP